MSHTNRKLGQSMRVNSIESSGVKCKGRWNMFKGRQLNNNYPCLFKGKRE